ncbi:hypothetical protein AAEO56_11580 [Flavobacterium sp. DGU11]|uniref:Uncharacterized protein n=1 Tax=Flavobacterium arundinis TaxID=3139143 RepID=A0ABU9HXL9_9FLAO
MELQDKIFLGIEKEPVQQSESVEIMNRIANLKIGKAVHFGNDLKDVAGLIRDEDYYIVFDNTITKGKQPVFKGKIIRVTKDEILVFIEDAIKGLSGRQYFLTTESFSQLLKISNEGGVYLFGA